MDAAADPVILANQRRLWCYGAQRQRPGQAVTQDFLGLNLLRRGVVEVVEVAPVVKVKSGKLQGPSIHVLHGPIPAPERRLLPRWSVLVSAQQRIRAFRRAFMEQIAQL